MKRYWLFMWERYEELGGMLDFAGDFNELEDVREEIYKVRHMVSGCDYNCGHILDTEGKKIIYNINVDGSITEAIEIKRQ